MAQGREGVGGSQEFLVELIKGNKIKIKKKKKNYNSLQIMDQKYVTR
jgi:hypothetical protein